LPGWQVKLTLSTARISPRFLSWKRLDRPRASIIEGPLVGSSEDRAQSVPSVLREEAGKCYSEGIRLKNRGTDEAALSSAIRRPRCAGIDCGGSAFVTDGALLGIKPVRRDAEHIVALDAHAVDDGTYDGAGLGWFLRATSRRSDGFLRDALGRHERILARRSAWSTGSLRHPWDSKVASLDR